MNFYGRDGFVVSGGPIFVLNADNKNLTDTSPVLGFLIGLREGPVEISYRYLSSKYFMDDDSGKTNHFMGSGLYFEVGLSIPISREPMKPLITLRFS